MDSICLYMFSKNAAQEAAPSMREFWGGENKGKLLNQSLRESPDWGKKKHNHNYLRIRSILPPLASWMCTTIPTAPSEQDRVNKNPIMLFYQNLAHPLFSTLLVVVLSLIRFQSSKKSWFWMFLLDQLLLQWRGWILGTPYSVILFSLFNMWKESQVKSFGLEVLSQRIFHALPISCNPHFPSKAHDSGQVPTDLW